MNYTKEKIESLLNVMDECATGVPCIEFVIRDINSEVHEKFVFNLLSHSCGGLRINEDHLSFWMKQNTDESAITFYVPYDDVTDVFSAENIFPKLRVHAFTGIGKRKLAYDMHAFCAEYYHNRKYYE